MKRSAADARTTRTSDNDRHRHIPAICSRGGNRYELIKAICDEIGKQHQNSMSSSHKPTGYTAVAPYLIVDGAAKTIEFLTRVFGANELRRFAGPDGKLAHAEVRIDDTVVMVADGAPSWPPFLRMCMSMWRTSMRHTNGP